MALHQIVGRNGRHLMNVSEKDTEDPIALERIKKDVLKMVKTKEITLLELYSVVGDKKEYKPDIFVYEEGNYHNAVRSTLVNSKRKTVYVKEEYPLKVYHTDKITIGQKVLDCLIDTMDGAGVRLSGVDNFELFSTGKYETKERKIHYLGQIPQSEVKDGVFNNEMCHEFIVSVQQSDLLEFKIRDVIDMHIGRNGMIESDIKRFYQNDFAKVRGDYQLKTLLNTLLVLEGNTIDQNFLEMDVSFVLRETQRKGLLK